MRDPGSAVSNALWLVASADPALVQIASLSLRGRLMAVAVARFPGRQA